MNTPDIHTQKHPKRRNAAMLSFFFILLQLLVYSKVYNESDKAIQPYAVKSTLKLDLVHTLRTTVRDHAARYELHGIDVARYQHTIQWNILKIAGVDFAFIKSTEGISLVDSFFQYNWEQAKVNGIRRGAYHFFNAEKDPVIQAIHFIVNTPMDANDLPPVLDVETLRGCSPAKMRAGVRVWLKTVEKAYGKRPLIYTNVTFYEKYLAGYFENYPLWIADYRGDKAEYQKYKQWKFWQHTDQGYVDGIPAQVDINVFNGTMSQLDSLCMPFRVPKPDSMLSAGKLSRKMRVILN
jgi:lysozyme